MEYIWQKNEWPSFIYDFKLIESEILLFTREASRVSGALDLITQKNKNETLIDIVASEVIKTSEIEGELYDIEDIRSSLRNQFGLSKRKEHVSDLRADDITRMIVYSRETFGSLLNESELHKWHSLLMKHYDGFSKTNRGTWREGEMEIVSGAIGREKIHYEAPSHKALSKEMSGFFEWFNETAPTSRNIQIPAPVRAAIAHLYFEVIHPYDDGNGRIGRAISEKALSQDLGRPVLLSLSKEILKNKKEYYSQLSDASRGSLNISKWVHYFVKLIYQAQLSSLELIEFIIFKSHFWRKFEALVNERQDKVLSRMFKQGTDGFEGGISAKKYMKITESSKATATRDLIDLEKKGCLVNLPGSGRSTSYRLPIKSEL